MILTSKEPNIFWVLFSIKNQNLLFFKPPVPLVGPKTRPLHEILTHLDNTENEFSGVFDGKQHPKNVWFHGY